MTIQAQNPNLDPEYAAFLDEMEAQRKRTEQNECRNGRHNWNHYYGGYCRCSVCGEEEYPA